MRNHEIITFVDDIGNKFFNTYYPGESETIPGDRSQRFKWRRKIWQIQEKE